VRVIFETVKHWNIIEVLFLRVIFEVLFLRVIFE